MIRCLDCSRETSDDNRRCPDCGGLTLNGVYARAKSWMITGGVFALIGGFATFFGYTHQGKGFYTLAIASQIVAYGAMVLAVGLCILFIALVERIVWTQTDRNQNLTAENGGNHT
jgi:hypothetical protein